MPKWKCTVCGYVVIGEQPPEKCPVCGAPKSAFVMLKEVVLPQRTVMDIIVEQLAAWGVKYVFGVPGRSNLALIDSLRKQETVKFILTRHEGVAALMASATAKLTDNVGVCTAITGPGATNLINGLYDAKMDRAPVLALTGQIAPQFIGYGAFQEIDLHALFEPVSIFNKSIENPEQTVQLLHLALKHALLDRGVAHLSLPVNVQSQPLTADIKPMEGYIPGQRITPPLELIDKAAKLLTSGERVVIIAGWGARKEGKILLTLAERIKAPIATTLRAKGIVPENHPLVLGVLGKAGTDPALKMVYEADILLVVGASYSEKTGIPPIRTIQVDLDPIIIGKKFPVEVGLLGESGMVLPELLKCVPEREDEMRLNCTRSLKKTWSEKVKKVATADSVHIKAPRIVYTLQRLVKPDAIISLDVGENCFWFGRFFEARNQTILMSGYLATMGFALAGALAAKLHQPEKQVVCVIGDGAFSMVMADFLTAVKYKLPLTVVIFNNYELSEITREQEEEGFQKYATELNNPNFADYAVSCGGSGLRVEEPSDLESAIRTALQSNKPVVVDVVTDPNL